MEEDGADSKEVSTAAAVTLERVGSVRVCGWSTGTSPHQDLHSCASCVGVSARHIPKTSL